MALITTGITSIAPEPHRPPVGAFMWAGQRGPTGTVSAPLPPILAGEVGHILALVGSSPELLQETKAKLGRVEREDTHVLPPESQPRPKRRTSEEKLDAKLDVRMHAAERRKLEQSASRSGMKVGAYARELLEQGLAFDRARALEKQEERELRRWRGH